VIDHAAKPDIAREILDPWRADLRALAELPNVYCKLSGLVTEARPGWHRTELAPYVTHLLSCFGPRRVMWGSDWPVLELATDYSTWMKTAQSLTRELNRDETTALFEHTASDFYRLR
jgi:L-fuconolactonase